MPRSLLAALLLVLAGCGSNLGNPASRVQLPSADRIYPITTIPAWPEPLPPTEVDRKHYGIEIGRPVARMMAAEAIAAPCETAGVSDALPAGARYAVGFCAPETFTEYKITVDGVQQPWPGTPTKLGPATTAQAWYFETPKTLVAPATGGSHPFVLTLIYPTGEQLSTIGTLVVTAVQPTCSYVLSASQQSFQAVGGSGNVAVTTTAGCPWTASSGASWLSVTAGASSSGPGSMTFSVTANTATTGRTGVLTIAGQAFTVSESAAVDSCDGAVVLAVGDWTRSGRVGDSGRVFWSLTKSRDPVTRVVVSVDGVDVPPIPQGTTDLRQFIGSYFTFPKVSGTHRLTVSAKDVNGCEDGSSRQMTISVK